MDVVDTLNSPLRYTGLTKSEDRVLVSAAALPVAAPLESFVSSSGTFSGRPDSSRRLRLP